MESNSVVLLGLSKAGKSTFLAALWTLLDSENTESLLKINAQPEDRSYLNKLRDAWLACEPIKKTHEIDHHIIDLDLTNTKTQSRLKISIPDLPGEAFLGAWSTRKLDLRIYHRLLTANGILLFIGLDNYNPLTILSRQRSLSELNTDEPIDPNEEPLNSAVEWDSKKHSSTDAILTELVQLALELSNQNTKKLKLGIVLSAWDSRVNPVEPRLYLAREYRLLNSLILTNTANLETQIYGLSAQGGAYDTDRDALLEQIDPERRIQFIYNELHTNDLTHSLVWMME